MTPMPQLMRSMLWLVPTTLVHDRPQHMHRVVATPLGSEPRVNRRSMLVQVRALGATLAADNGAEAAAPGSGSSTAAIVGGVVGGIVALAVVAAVAGNCLSRELQDRAGPSRLFGAAHVFCCCSVV